MKLGFVLVLLTCALLFPQQKQPTPACVAKCGREEAACTNTAKTEANRKSCEKKNQECVAACNKK